MNKAMLNQREPKGVINHRGIEIIEEKLSKKQYALYGKGLK